MSVRYVFHSPGLIKKKIITSKISLERVKQQRNYWLGSVYLFCAVVVVLLPVKNKLQTIQIAFNAMGLFPLIAFDSHISIVVIMKMKR